jgi:hypothetical protein
VHLNAVGQLKLKLKTPRRDGTTHLAMPPLKSMQRRIERRLLGSQICERYSGNWSIAGLREQRLTGSTILETGLPESNEYEGTSASGSCSW